MAKAERAYFYDGKRYSPSAFKRLSRSRKIDAMVEWFGSNYEDPAERTSYVSAEGGYLWNHGGPFDASEELYSEFSDLVSEPSIEDAVRIIEEDGIVDWASANDEYYEEFDEDGNRSVDLPFPDEKIDLADDEVSIRSELAGRLDRVEKALKAYSAVRQHRGHNHPPELIDDDDPLTDGDLLEVEQAVAGLREEAVSEGADASRVNTLADKLKSVAGKLWKGAKVVGEMGGIAAVVVPVGQWLYAHQAELFGALTSAAQAASEWAEHLLDLWM